MAAAGIRLLRDSALWERTSRAARAAAVERYSAARVVPIYEQLYREVVTGKQAAAGRAQSAGQGA
jgi:glycosyltransferase involved in cell wall biosynthesis